MHHIMGVSYFLSFVWGVGWVMGGGESAVDEAIISIPRVTDIVRVVYSKIFMGHIGTKKIFLDYIKDFRITDTRYIIF